ETFAPDFEALRHDFNQSVMQLGATLRAISDSIVTIDEGTREISSGASDLAKRTDQQAEDLDRPRHRSDFVGTVGKRDIRTGVS
ncbi:hypothetical protein ACC764_38770, partial [Rhizobium ruizarguesonis]